MGTKSLLIIFVILKLTNVTFSQHQSPSKFIKTGILPEKNFTTLHQFLSDHSNGVKDTLLIRLYYNNGTCWMIKDKSDSDQETREWIQWNQKQVANAVTARPGLSFFEFREPGNRANRVIRWNNQIIIDSNHVLHSLLFKKKNRCSNSILILPDRRFVLFEGDAHNDLLLHFDQIEHTAIEKLKAIDGDIN